MYKESQSYYSVRKTKKVNMYCTNKVVTTINVVQDPGALCIFTPRTLQ